MLAVAGAIRIGLAPTSSDLLHLAPASGFDPIIKCTCAVESTAVSNAGAMVESGDGQDSERGAKAAAVPDIAEEYRSVDILLCHEITSCKLWRGEVVVDQSCRRVANHESSLSYRNFSLS